MTLSLRHRPVPTSPVARWDARWKLAAVIAAVVGITSLTHVAPAAAAFGAGLAFVAASRLPWRMLRGWFAVLGSAVLPFLLVLPFTLDDGGRGFDLGPLHASTHGAIVAAALSCRCLAIGCFALVLVSTAPVHHTLAAAHRIGMPSVLVRLMLLAYRYAFLLADELRRLRIALRVRGFRARANTHSYRTLGHVTGALLVRGADRAEHVAEAMRVRGFDGQFHTLTGFRTSSADVLSFLAMLAGTIALVIWDRLF